jgi:hypothetical protein
MYTDIYVAEECVTVVIALFKAADMAAGMGFWATFILAFFMSTCYYGTRSFRRK